MLTIENVVEPSTQQWGIVISGMRNPMNSWDKSDSFRTYDGSMIIGGGDMALMLTLCKRGPEHAKFRRMLPVVMTINAPLYWWKEMDTYKTGTTASSCSTMHKIAEKEFSLDDFSHEHLKDIYLCMLEKVITQLNGAREEYAESGEKDDWWQMIQLLPASYNQKRTVALNYEVLSRIYKSRKNHKLDEWRTFCEAIERLPYSEIITA